MTPGCFRVDSEHIILSAAVYDNLRQRYENRIHAMLQYVKTDNQCRSRQLLRYFGESNGHDCGQCDVCMRYHHTQTNSKKRQEAQQLILDLLADHKPHHITQLQQLPLPYEQIDAALEYLMLEEFIYIDTGYLTLA